MTAWEAALRDDGEQLQYLLRSFNPVRGERQPLAGLSQAERFCDHWIDATARTGPPSLCAVTWTAPLAVKAPRGTVQLTLD